MTKSSFATKSVAFILAALLCAACLLTLAGCKKKRGGEDTVGNSSETIVNERETAGQSYVLDSNRELVLLLAVDEEKYTVDGHELEGGRAVAIFIASIDTANKKIDMIQLDQNTMADMRTFNRYGLSEGSANAQLALAYAYGDGGTESGQNILSAVKNVTGLPLSSYVAVKSSAMPALSQLSGPVTITLSDDQTKINAAYTEGSTVTLQPSEFEDFLSETSVGFGANQKRMARMRDFMPAFFAALAPKKDQAEAQLTALKSNLQYNLTDAELLTLLTKAAEYTMNDVVTPAGETQAVGDSLEFTIDNDSLNQILINTCFKVKGN